MNFYWNCKADSEFIVNSRNRLIQCEFTWQTANTRLKEQIHLNSRKTNSIQSEFIMNSPSVSWFYNEFDIFFAYSWFIMHSDWINFPIEFTMITLSASRFHYEITLFRKFSKNSLPVSIATSSWIFYLFREFTINSLSYLRISYGFTLNTSSFSASRIHLTLKKIFAKSTWINYLNYRTPLNSLFYSQMSLNSIFLSRIH